MPEELSAAYGESRSFPTQKTWLVTGGSRGLGRSIVVAALEANDRVYATARSASAFDDLKAKYPRNLFTGNLDVTDMEAVAAHVEAAFRALGSLDVVVNNAGYADVASIEDADLDAFRAQFETNFFGTLYVTRAVLPVMRNQGHGHILQIATVGARLGTPGLGAYQSAKWAVTGLSAVLANEIKPFGVNTTIIQPGGMRTEWAGPSMKIPDISKAYEQSVGVVAKMLRQFSGQQNGDPRKIAGVIVNLSREEHPPLELLVGADAYENAEQAGKARAETDRKWKVVSESVSY